MADKLNLAAQAEFESHEPVRKTLQKAQKRLEKELARLEQDYGFVIMTMPKRTTKFGDTKLDLRFGFVNSNLHPTSGQRLIKALADATRVQEREDQKRILTPVNTGVVVKPGVAH